MQDVSQKVRNLPQKAACRILETHFGSIWSEAFLGVTEPISSVPLTQERATIVEKYRNWLKGITSSLIVPGIQENLSIVEDWLSLQTKQHGEKQESFEAKYIPELYPLSVVTGEPGSGKSTLIKYLSHRLSGAGKIVLRVRLPSVRKILSICSSFDDAILQDAISTSSLSKEQAQFALSNPDYLFADGLDECEDDRANIAEKLRF